MSKLGKKIILLPKDSTIKVDGNNLLVSGPKGSKTINFNSKLFSSKTNEKNEFQILPIKKTKNISVLWGTYRSLLNNAVIGVSKGHEKTLGNVRTVGAGQGGDDIGQTRQGLIDGKAFPASLR